MARYRIRRVPFIISEIDALRPPFGLWDTPERVYVDKFGRPDPDYYAVSREVAVMRRRDLNEYARNPR